MAVSRNTDQNTSNLPGFDQQGNPIGPEYYGPIYDKNHNLIARQGSGQQYPNPSYSSPVSNSPSSSPGSTVPATGGDNPLQNYLSKFQGQPYANSQIFQNLIKNFSDRGVQFGVDTSQPTFNQVSSYAEEFRAQFNNAAGRDPNQQEYDQFFNHLMNEAPWVSSIPASQMQNDVQSLLGTQFSSDINNAALAGNQAKANAAIAPGSAFDVWKQAVLGNVQNTQQQLQDYQQKLFQKLQPQLLTSLQAKGLLDTGGLNQAFAGAATDLTNANQAYIADLQNQTNQNIANQQYAIQSSPTNTALQTSLSIPSNLTSNGQTALNNAFNQSLQQSLLNQQFGNQQNLLNQQYANQPSYLQQVGGTIAGGLASGIGRGLLR